MAGTVDQHSGADVKLTPYEQGPVKVIVRDNWEEIRLFGYAAARSIEGRSYIRFYREPGGSYERVPADDAFNDEFGRLLDMGRHDSLIRDDLLGRRRHSIRLRACISPRVAALLAFWSGMDIHRSPDDPQKPVTFGKFSNGLGWVRFPSDAVGMARGVYEYQVSPEHAWPSFEPLSG